MKNIAFVALATVALLLIPLLAHFPWTLSDFVVAGVLIFGFGSALTLVWKKAGRYRIVSVGLIVFLFVWLWAELAVGVFTNWGS
jgi:hypothetical protein